jgi:hypothetical protein
LAFSGKAGLQRLRTRGSNKAMSFPSGLVGYKKCRSDQIFESFSITFLYIYFDTCFVLCKLQKLLII